MWELSPTAVRSTYNGGRSRASLLPLHGCSSGAGPDRCSRTPASRAIQASAQSMRDARSSADAIASSEHSAGLGAQEDLLQGRGDRVTLTPAQRFDEGL